VLFGFIAFLILQNRKGSRAGLDDASNKAQEPIIHRSLYGICLFLRFTVDDEAVAARQVALKQFFGIGRRLSIIDNYLIRT